MLIVWELIVKSSVSIVVSHSVLFGVLEWTFLPPPPGRTNENDQNLESLTLLRVV